MRASLIFSTLAVGLLVFCLTPTSLGVFTTEPAIIKEVAGLPLLVVSFLIAPMLLCEGTLIATRSFGAALSAMFSAACIALGLLGALQWSGQLTSTTAVWWGCSAFTIGRFIFNAVGVARLGLLSWNPRDWARSMTKFWGTIQLSTKGGDDEKRPAVA